MTIELAHDDQVQRPVAIETDDFLRACAPPQLSEKDILDCFLEAKLDGSYRQYLLAAGRAIEAKLARPVDMVLHCPRCRAQHIDAPDGKPATGWMNHEHTADRWTNPPHRSHLCHACGCTWRPADVPTNGVAAITTRGAKDSA